MDTSHSPVKAQKVTTLFVSTSDKDHAALKQIFALSNWSLHAAYNSESALAQLRSGCIPVVICDGDSPECDWRMVLSNIDKLPHAPKVIVSSRNVNERLWADILQSGAYDLLEMPWEPREVFRVVARGWRSWDFARRAECTLSRVAGVAAAAA